MGKINPNDFIDENDRKALDALKKIPGFDQLVKAFMKVWSEPSMRIINMSSKVRLSEQQCPRIYNLLVPICEKYEIEMPELYLELDRNPNAYTSGDNTIFITVTTGLLEVMSDNEIQSVLAHEVGHIICHHVLYHTMGRILLSGAGAILGLNGLITTAISAAFAYWMRCSEFSADRAAAVFDGGSDGTVHAMLRLAGGSKEVANEIDADLFIEQAKDYQQYIGDSKWNKVLEFIALYDKSHPFLAVRAAAIRNWCESDQFRYVMDVIEGRVEAPTTIVPPTGATGRTVSCPKCGTVSEEGWRFCRKCGQPLSTSKICPGCGTQLAADAVFCPKCGKQQG